MVVQVVICEPSNSLLIEILEDVPINLKKTSELNIQIHHRVLKYVSENHTEPISTDKGSSAYFRALCNGRINGGGYATSAKCYFVHHLNPFLKLGPFHVEVKVHSPFITLIHDFFLNIEMDWLVTYSKPRLSKKKT